MTIIKITKLSCGHIKYIETRFKLCKLLYCYECLAYRTQKQTKTVYIK